MQRNLHCFFRSEGRLIAGTIRFFDLFSGIGGFREGLHRAGGFTCVGHCEADAYADHNYRVLFDTEGEWFCNDARNIETERMPDFDLLCAGFPCQAFSIAGRREGFADARGTLFFEVARLVADKRPAYFLLENVPYALQRIRHIMNRNQLCVVPPKSSETEQKSPVSLHIIFGFSQARTATQSTPYPVPNEMPLEDQDELSLSPKQLAWPRYLLWRRPQW